jgi:predicted dehydrogenase
VIENASHQYFGLSTGFKSNQELERQMNDVKEPVRIGIVGCGVVMTEAYMPLIESLEYKQQAKVTIACDVAESKREKLKERFGITRFTTDYNEVVSSDEVDLVMVLTSMLEHAEITMAALRAGKHVLVEKPMATTFEEASDIVELSRESKGHLLCAPHIILSPTYQTIWRRVHAGNIGRVCLARARYGWAGTWWGKWFYRPGGGAIFDLAVYNMISLTGLLGPVKRVTAMVGIAIPERIVDGERIKVEAEDNAHILLDFGNSVFAVVTTGWTMQKYRSPAIELYGTSGTIQMLGDDWDPNGYEIWQNEVGAWQVFEETHANWPWTDGLRHLVECIHAGRELLIRPEHALHVVEVMLKAQESGRDGQARTIDTIFPPLDFEESLETEAAHLIHDRSRS